MICYQLFDRFVIVTFGSVDSHWFHEMIMTLGGAHELIQ